MPVIKARLLNTDWYNYTLQYPQYPDHLKRKEWGFKPAAPLVLDIGYTFTPRWHDHPMLQWFRENNVKRLNASDSRRRWSTWLFPDLETKTMWLLQSTQWLSDDY